MTQGNSQSHAFIVRLWAEPRERAGAPPAWRGMIRHAQSGAQRYFCDVEDVPALLRPYLGGADPAESRGPGAGALDRR